MPFVYIGFGSWEGVTLSAYLLWMILITGSRSGAVAGVITFAALVLLRPNIRRPVAAPIRSRLLYVGLAAALIVGIAVPFTENDPAAYTGRAYLWSLAWKTLSDPADMWYGTGVRSLLRMHESGQLVYPVYSVHNQWLQVVLSAGIIGLVLFLTALVLLLWNARGAYSLVAGCVLLPGFLLAITERPWPIDSLELLVWTVPAALLSYPAIKRRGKSLDSNPIRAPEAGARAQSAAEERPGDTLSVGSGD
jgi:O-antigen ligase